MLISLRLATGGWREPDLSFIPSWKRPLPNLCIGFCGNPLLHMMDILPIAIITIVIAVGGFWMVSRPTKPLKKRNGTRKTWPARTAKMTYRGRSRARARRSSDLGLVKDKSILDLKGMFKPPEGKHVSIADMNPWKG